MTMESIMIAVVPTLGPADNVMSVWDSGLISWPKVKTYTEIILPFGLGSLVILVFIILFLVKIILTRLKILRADPKWIFRIVRRRARKLIRDVNKADIPDAELTIRILNHIKILVGLNVGLSPEKSQASSANELLMNSLIKDKKQLSIIRSTNPVVEYLAVANESIEDMVFKESYDKDVLKYLLNNMKSYLKKMRFSYHPA